MPVQLKFRPFSKDYLAELSNFDCGEELWEIAAQKWIVEEHEATIKRGTRIWLYFDNSDQLVGFGSLGTTQLRYPDLVESKRVKVAVIPYLAIHRSSQGMPPGDSEFRYSSQMMRHIISEAESMPIEAPVLSLYAHPQNLGAIKLYRRFGFVEFGSFHDQDDATTYHRMILSLKLRDYLPS